jgi:hypothetical protein
MRRVATSSVRSRAATVGQRVVAVTILAAVLASCGSGGLAPRAARDLAGRYELLADAVNAGDGDEALRALRQLERAVDDLRSSGAIDDARAEEILAAVADVRSELRLLPTTSPSVEPSPSVVEPTPISPSPVLPEDDEGDGDDGDEADGPGNSQGHGEGQGDGEGHGQGNAFGNDDED